MVGEDNWGGGLRGFERVIEGMGLEGVTGGGCKRIGG